MFRLAFDLITPLSTFCLRRCSYRLVFSGSHRSSWLVISWLLSGLFYSIMFYLQFLLQYDRHSKTAHSTATDANGLKLALEGDLDVRKFDVERVMCAHCDRWIPIGSDGSEEALQAWFKHKKACWAKTPPQQLSFRQLVSFSSSL